jgi:hypothetical protein
VHLLQRDEVGHLTRRKDARRLRTPGKIARAYRYVCDEHKPELEGLENIEPVEVSVLSEGVMTFERAYELLGYETPRLDERVHTSVRHKNSDCGQRQWSQSH